jgi:hypothetical protein
MKYLWLLILFSCQQNSQSEIAGKLYTRWLGGIDIINIHENIKQGESIKEPRGTWQQLFTVVFYDRSFQKQYDCVYYQVPSDGEAGVWGVVFNGYESKCSAIPAKKDLERSEIFNFAYKLNRIQSHESHIELFVDQNKLEFRLSNFSNGKIQNRMLGNSVIESQFTGLRVSSPVDPLAEPVEKKLGDGTICHEPDNSCESQINYQCDQCENGWYEVVASECPTSFKKVCGQDPCGQKGSTACVRGYVATGYKLNYCINDSPVGFCNEGFRVYCFNKELVCR